MIRRNVGTHTGFFLAAALLLTSLAASRAADAAGAAAPPAVITDDAATATLANGVVSLTVCLRVAVEVPYDWATVYCDPPSADRAITALGLSSQCDELKVLPEPVQFSQPGDDA